MTQLLFIDWSFDPILFSIGGVEIRYYGLMWVLTILIGAKLFEHFVKREGLPESVSDSIFWYGTLGTILGARLGHCLFYDPSYYLSHPLTIITGFRDGGLASHGAAIGLLIGLWLFARKNRLPYLWGLDRIMIAVGIGGALVRFGNLFNSEIFGGPTTLPWGFRFLLSREWQTVCAPAACHPTQIYEALCYLITFVILCLLYYRFDYGRKRPGMIFGVGLIVIFMTRFLIEYVKLEQGGADTGLFLKMGQLLSIPFILLGFWMIFRAYKRGEQQPATVQPTPPSQPASKAEKMAARRAKRENRQK